MGRMGMGCSRLGDAGREGEALRAHEVVDGFAGGFFRLLHEGGFAGGAVAGVPPEVAEVVEGGVGKGC